jgi:hypothetical protein
VNVNEIENVRANEVVCESGVDDESFVKDELEKARWNEDELEKAKWNEDVGESLCDH